MKEIWTILIAVIAVTTLSAGWVGVQLLARKLGTKNHIDNASTCGNGCTCMSTGKTCSRD